MTQETSFGAETAKWPSTRQNCPITTPPRPGSHTATPSAPPGGWLPPSSTSLPGLESLMHLDRVFIDQRIEPWEVATGFHRKNSYAIVNVNGQQLFEMKEDSSLLGRMFCGSSREFDIKVYDMSKRQVLNLHRPMELYLGQLEVHSAGERLGSIHKQCSLCPSFEIRNEAGRPTFQVDGSYCDCNCFGAQQFQVYAPDRSRQIGVITKEWSGLARELFTRADVFGVSFPINLAVQQKALLIATAILIDFEYFEQN